VPFVIPLSRTGESLSRQLYHWLRGKILLGHLRAGERLPATRDLAEQLHVSRTVVLLAYDQLLAEGFVQGRHGSGTYVCEGLTAKREGVARKGARVRLSPFGTAAEAAAPKPESAKGPTTVVRYDFSYRRPPVERFPFETWQRILTRRSRNASVRMLDYAAAAGSLELRRAIAEHLRRSRAVTCDASQVIIVNGSQQALDLAARVLLERGDVAVVEDPHYLGARDAFFAAGAKLHPVPVDHDGLTPSKLPKRARLAFVTPSHQFPTGTILPVGRRMALLEWAKRAGAVVIEDDYDGEFRYEGRPVESMQGLDRDGRVIYVGTFSRTIFPALRIGYLIAPRTLVSALSAAKWLCDRHTATLEQETLAEFIATGAYERHLRRSRRVNALRREVLLESIRKFLGNRVDVTGEGSGAHVVLWPRKRVFEDAVIAEAAANGVGIYGIARYFSKRPRKAGFMLGYARMKEEDIREGVRKLAQCL
jgi:GntR family transcriptional regulator / MocR family aminotransferase